MEELIPIILAGIIIYICVEELQSVSSIISMNVNHA